MPGIDLVVLVKRSPLLAATDLELDRPEKSRLQGHRFIGITALMRTRLGLLTKSTARQFG
jgi:hypothetical protein